MSTSTASPDTTSVSSNQIATALAIGSVLAALGCLGYISLNGDTPRESFSNPVNTVAGIAATIGAVVLALTLAKWRTTTLPAWALTVSAAGLVMVAANSWFAGTGIRAIADHTSNEQFKDLHLRGTLAHRDVGTEHGAVPGGVPRAGSRRLAAAIAPAVVQCAPRPRPRRAGIRVPGVPARAAARLGRSLHRVAVGGAVITTPRRLVESVSARARSARSLLTDVRADLVAI